MRNYKRLLETSVAEVHVFVAVVAVVVEVCAHTNYIHTLHIQHMHTYAAAAAYGISLSVRTERLGIYMQRMQECNRRFTIPLAVLLSFFLLFIHSFINHSFEP